MSRHKRPAALLTGAGQNGQTLYDALLEDRRLRILRLLQGMPAFVANDAVLQLGLEQLGHPVSASRLRTDLSWLAEMGLLMVTTSNGLMVCQLREHGAAVALGRSTVPGVARPSPEA